MNLRQRYFAAVLLLLAVALAACGEKPEPDPDGPGGGSPIELGAQLEQLSSAGENRPDPIAGVWEGELRQQGQPVFPVRVRLVSLTGPRNRVSYGGRIDCTGHWTFLRGQGPVAEFEEVINEGAGDNCKGRGIVRLELGARGNLDYEFRGGGIESRGVLRRAD
jgi:hypothetical protein